MVENDNSETVAILILNMNLKQFSQYQIYASLTCACCKTSSAVGPLVAVIAVQVTKSLRL